ncbi:MAG TPA: polysaccharide deacetylase family protein [Rickettsia endosymbiont of Sericostoma sp.]|jgi:peptidoglycan/xylan/chitin deacetylase (PgdA/CDA1 family)|uniref:polysaccharide deacetylase family protein n=2 Tax=unclassified Candidatus Tisiphia TaxID=2996318 RepID=UPI001DE3855A|nr:polysaccharide deacetylase family protein [Rickettsia endosymbiont of Sericostoma sp.]
MTIIKIFTRFNLFLLLFMTSIFYSVYSYASQTIYITSDDGPLKGTKNIITVMTEEKIPVTMFMVGLHHDSSSWSKNIVMLAKKSPFIQIGNHSYSHAHNHYQQFYHDFSNVINDLKKNNDTLGLKGSHIDTRLPGRNVFRLPNLSRDDPYISKQEDRIEKIDDDGIYKNGFYLYGWDLEWAHYNNGCPVQSVEHLVEEIANKFAEQGTALPNKLILLMHDEMFQDCFNGKENLRNLISALRKKNYKFDFIKNYNP